MDKLSIIPMAMLILSTCVVGSGAMDKLCSQCSKCDAEQCPASESYPHMTAFDNSLIVGALQSDLVESHDRGLYSVPNPESLNVDTYFGWESTSGSASGYHRFNNYMDKCSGGQSYLTVDNHGEVSLRSIKSLDDLAEADWKSFNPPPKLNHKQNRFWVSRSTGKCLTVFGNDDKKNIKRRVGVADCRFDGSNPAQLFAFRFHYHGAFCCCGLRNNGKRSRATRFLSIIKRGIRTVQGREPIVAHKKAQPEGPLKLLRPLHAHASSKLQLDSEAITVRTPKNQSNKNCHVFDLPQLPSSPTEFSDLQQLCSSRSFPELELGWPDSSPEENSCPRQEQGFYKGSTFSLCNPWINVIFVFHDGEEKHIKVATGTSILQAAHENDIELEGACEGSLACSTCHVKVLDMKYYNILDEPVDEENDMLDLAFGLTPTSRLACQLIATPEMDGIRLCIPAATRNFAVDGYVPKPH